MKMQFRSKNTVLGAAIISMLVIAVFTAITYLSSSPDDGSSALSYSTSSDLSFTFKPTLSIGLSTDSLTIDNLVPGTTSDSNTVTVTVSSNTPYGYVLSAGVGSSDSTSTYYNTSDLVHDNSTIPTPTTSKFTSIDTAASLSNLTTDNTWGYSTSTDNGTTWSTYSGLSHTTTKPLLDISDPATPSTIDFKIAARSSTTQASGTYNNVITFYAVGKPEPMSIRKIEYMQDFKALSSEDKQLVLESMPVGQQYKLTDNRDGNAYWIAKQADGNIWMTQNLDLCIGCEGTAVLTSKNTDLNSIAGVGSLAYLKGYTKVDGVITWSPYLNAITSNRAIYGTTVSPAFGTGNAGYWGPYSVEGGNFYVYTSNSEDDDYVYDSLESCTSAGHSADNCAHYHVGNYYSWSAAIASNDSEALENNNGVAANSICPAGWRLPRGQATDYDYTTNREFGELFRASGVTSSVTAVSYAVDGMNKLRVAPLYFIRSGYVNGSTLNKRSNFFAYWSNTIRNRFSAYGARFDDSYVGSSGNSDRGSGFSVRCLVRN